MRQEIKLSDQEIEARFESLGIFLCVDDLTFTRDTLDNFLGARKNWVAPGRVTTHKNDTLYICDARAVKGQPRSDLIVIDFGTVRAAYR